MIYIDIDGVLADSDGFLATLDPQALKDTHRLFKTIYKNYTRVFKESKPLVDLSFLKNLKEFTLLTALPNSRNIDSFAVDEVETKSIMKTLEDNKKQWVAQHIGDCNLIILELRADKSKFCKSKDDILIDDNKDTGKRWKAAGGRYFSNVAEYLNSINDQGVSQQLVECNLFD